MKKIIDGKEYYISGSLTKEQRKIYCHIIDWKKEHMPDMERGVFRGHEYDTIFPGKYSEPPMLNKKLVPIWKKMQHGEYAYKLHMFASHAVSSQTACVNLFLPILLSENVNNIIPKIKVCPSYFKEIARDKLYHGFCFEYWGKEILNGKGVLNDHSRGAGTDADVAIAYYNTDNELCLWLIEHKLSEKDFTTCGGYRSKANNNKDICEKCLLSDIAKNPKLCHYHKIGYKYWEYFNRNIDKFKGHVDIEGCPFRGGLNQLWRNQILGFALQETGTYKTVTFSVCHHVENHMLSRSMDMYRTMTNNNSMFSSFTNYDVLDAVSSDCSELKEWKGWYKDVYCF